MLADGKVDAQHLDTVYGFLWNIAKFRPDFRLVTSEERDFIRKARLQPSINRIAKLVADSEAKLFDTRAKALRVQHPLAIQVHLDNGVANGVLVVRTIKDCAELLFRLLTDSCEFEIVPEERQGATLLVEKISRCPLRVVTDNRTITNSFWSWYLTKN